MLYFWVQQCPQMPDLWSHKHNSAGLVSPKWNRLPSRYQNFPEKEVDNLRTWQTVNPGRGTPWIRWDKGRQHDILQPHKAGLYAKERALWHKLLESLVLQEHPSQNLISVQGFTQFQPHHTSYQQGNCNWKAADLKWGKGRSPDPQWSCFYMAHTGPYLWPWTSLAQCSACSSSSRK